MFDTFLDNDLMEEKVYFLLEKKNYSPTNQSKLLKNSVNIILVLLDYFSLFIIPVYFCSSIHKIIKVSDG